MSQLLVAEARRDFTGSVWEDSNKHLFRMDGFVWSIRSANGRNLRASGVVIKCVCHYNLNHCGQAHDEFVTLTEMNEGAIDNAWTNVYLLVNEIEESPLP